MRILNTMKLHIITYRYAVRDVRPMVGVRQGGRCELQPSAVTVVLVNGRVHTVTVSGRVLRSYLRSNLAGFATATCYGLDHVRAYGPPWLTHLVRSALDDTQPDDKLCQLLSKSITEQLKYDLEDAPRMIATNINPGCRYTPAAVVVVRQDGCITLIEASCLTSSTAYYTEDKARAYGPEWLINLVTEEG